MFVNHGDPAACEALRDTLHADYGCKAIAPYSGNSYDLLTDTVLNDDAGVPVKASPRTGDSRAARLYETLVAAANELLAVAKGSRGISNKDTAAFTEQIRALIRRFK